ncbi:MAG: hypothetical protein ABW110_02030 [Steroidobacteraceae bacterium]
MNSKRPRRTPISGDILYRSYAEGIPLLGDAGLNRPVSQKDLAKYIGGYGTSNVVFEIERRGDKISGKTSEQQFELEALSATKFRFSEHSNVYADDSVVTFRTDARGRVTGLVFEGGGQLAKLR